MAITAYCKKCDREVEPGEICPRCGTRLAKTAVHAAWVVKRRPLADWMCWNAVMRWLLPAGAAVLILALVLEGLSGGAAAVEQLFRGSFPMTLLILFAAVTAVVAIALCLQGPELMDYVVDSRGVHVTRYVPRPTALKLLTRMKSPRMLNEVNWDAEAPVLRLEERDLPWRAVARVQLWPEKCYILFYAPAWWLRIPVRCTPFSWDDALYFVRDKLGKRKKVSLPEHLRTPAAPKAATGTARRAAARPQAAPAETDYDTDRNDPSGFQDPSGDFSPAFSDEASPETVPPSAGEQTAMDI